MKGLLSEAEPPTTVFAKIKDIFTPDAFSNRPSTRRIGPTSWLDGLRGWAALCVTFMHLTVYTHEGLELCYGSKYRHSDELNTSPVALPIIRLPFTGGHFAVMLFFVISGYVVPRRLLQLLQENRKQEFLDDIRSAMVRRPIRLFLPVLLSTAAVFTCWHLFGIKTPWPKQQSNIVLEAWEWLLESSLFTYFFRIGWLYTYYNVHSWTIPVELRGSMFMFVFLFVVHTVSTQSRVYMTILMVLHLTIGAPGAWYACFFGGMLLSDLDLIAQSGRGVTFVWDGADRWLRKKKALRSIALHFCLISSLYLASQPSGDWSTRAEILGACPGWGILSSLIPYHYVDLDSQYRWFWLFWAALLMMYCVREISWLRRCFETSTAQYLGKHSFALYLIHGPMIGMFSERLFYLTGVKQAWQDEQKEMYAGIQNKLRDAPWWPLPSNGIFGLEPNFLFCVAVSIPTFLWVAEIGTRAFDMPSVKAARWFWQKWKTL